MIGWSIHCMRAGNVLTVTVPMHPLGVVFMFVAALVLVPLCLFGSPVRRFLSFVALCVLAGLCSFSLPSHAVFDAQTGKITVDDRPFFVPRRRVFAFKDFVGVPRIVPTDRDDQYHYGVLTLLFADGKSVSLSYAMDWAGAEQAANAINTMHTEYEMAHER